MKKYWATSLFYERGKERKSEENVLKLYLSQYSRILMQGKWKSEENV